MMTTREKLIHSAIKLFSEKGFEATSTTAICTDAGFSSGALFVHFKTKNDLLDFLYIDIKREYFRRAGTIKQAGKDMFEIAKEMMVIGAEYYIAEPEKFVFIKRFINSPHVSRLAKEEVNRELEGMNNFFELGKKQGRIKDFPNELLYQSLTGAYYGLIEYLIERGEELKEEYMQAVLEVIKKD